MVWEGRRAVASGRHSAPPYQKQICALWTWNMMKTPKIEIRRVGVETILDLRHRILRAGLPPESARFDGDEAATTLHWAAFALDFSGRAEEKAVGCLSLMLNSLDGEPAWQLRGMAVEAARQGLGLGRALMVRAEEAAAREGAAGWLWCNARVPAIGFYQKHGWTTISEVFAIPTAGPHVRMSKKLKDVNRRETVEKTRGSR
jgi:GNAT superfamily N-acetyltransferase